MPNHSAQALQVLSERSAAWAQRAYVPFSHRPEAALLVLADGSWVPGVRVESASYSLTIPALLNAYTTLMTLSRDDIVAVCLSRPLRPEEIVFSHSIRSPRMEPAAENILAARGFDANILQEEPLSPFLPDNPPASTSEGIAMARQLARRAYVPESNFPVAAILETEDGLLIPGVNVENADWSQTLCAERNALGTAITYGISSFVNLYLTCLKDDDCSPCGACRQLLAELSPTVKLWMDRGSNPEQPPTPEKLLPASFIGRTLFNKQTQS